MQSSQLWKINVSAKLEIGQIERASQKVLGDLGDADAPICGVELKRIDIFDNSTLVYVGAHPSSAQAFVRCLEAAAPAAKASCAETVAEELLSAKRPKAH